MLENGPRPYTRDFEKTKMGAVFEKTKRTRRSHGFFVFSEHCVVATVFRLQILHIKNQPTVEKKTENV